MSDPAFLRFHPGFWGVAVLLVLVLPVGPAQASPTVPRAAAGPGGAPTASGVPATLSFASSGYDLNPDFWGTTVSSQAHLMPGEADAVAATPARTLVFPGAEAGDRTDLLNDTFVSDIGGKLVWAKPETNLTQFIALCREISCQAIMQVPGEIDDPAFAAQVVSYVQTTLGFVPAYWEVGNEPELWKHWDVPWDQWNTPSQGSGTRVTPSEYAWELHNYTLAMQAVDPSIQILGLAGTGRPQHKIPLSTWINETVAVNPRSLAGIAFHVYVAGTKGSPALSAFYGSDPAADPYSLGGRVDDARSAISATLNATCPGCPDPPLFITEFGSALSHFRYGNLSRGFAGGLAMAAEAVLAADYNVSNLDVFATELNTSNSWFNVEGGARPDYTVYAQFLSHLGNYVIPASLAAPAIPPYTGSNTTLNANLYALASESTSSGRRDLLVMNQNVSTNVSFAPTLPGVPAGSPAEVWEWTGEPYYSATNDSWWVEPETVQPQALFFPGGLPASFTLPAQTLALFEAYPGSSTQVEFQSSGLPSGARWYLSVGTSEEESTNSTIITLLSAGTYATLAPPLSLPAGSFYPNPKERLAGFPPADVAVATTPLVVPVPYEKQWEVTLTSYPSRDGRVGPAYGWANASVPTLLTATPTAGFLVVHWTGHGHGSYNGGGTQATIRALSSIEENVSFARGYDATFSESGLPASTPWSVEVAKQVYASSTTVDLVPEVNGTYDFTVGSVPGFYLLPSDLTFHIQGQGVGIALVFAPIVPLFHVRWQESGLPEGTPWWVEVSGTSYPSFGSSLTLPLANGTYLYAIPDAAGLAPSIRSGSVSVQGLPTVVPVVFGPFSYPVVITTSGLPAGITWQLRIGGKTVPSTTGELQLTEANGTFSWRAISPIGYVAVPSNGTFTVNGSGTRWTLDFSPALVAATPPIYGYPAVGTTLLVVVVGVVALAALAFVLPPQLPATPRRAVASAPPRGPTARPPPSRGGPPPTRPR